MVLKTMSKKTTQRWPLE